MNILISIVFLITIWIQMPDLSNPFGTGQQLNPLSMEKN